MLEVTAALIRDKDQFMICQRPAHKARGMLWEFPGGKLEPGETLQGCLIRECKEELGVTLSLAGVFTDVVYAYPEMEVHLTLFDASISEGIVQKIEHNAIRWITADQIDDYDFCPADTEILERVKSRFV